MSLVRSTLFKSISLTAIVSALISVWVYWGTDFKVQQLLMSREWQSRIVTLIEKDINQNPSIQEIRRVDVNSNVKYLPNHTYIRVSAIKVYSSTENKIDIDISESGTWTLSDDYLLISPTEFKDMAANAGEEFTQEQLDIVTQFFRMDAQQSRHVDVVNTNTLLLTSLNHDSVTLFARPLHK